MLGHGGANHPENPVHAKTLRPLIAGLVLLFVGTACVLEGSVTQGIARMPEGARKTVSIEHPSGEFSVELELDPDDDQTVSRAALLRTARLIMRGEVMVPASAYPETR